MRPRHPLQARLALGALALLVAVVAILGTWQVLSARSSQLREVDTAQAAEAHLASSALSSALSIRLELISNLAAQPALSSIFLPKNRSGLPKLAAALHLLYPTYASFDIFAGNGRLEAHWPSDPALIGRDASSNGGFSGAVRSKRPYISQAWLQSTPPRELVVGLAAPVFSVNGTIVGVLMGTLAASTISSISGGAALGDATNLVIVDQDGHALSGPGASATLPVRSTVVSKALAGRSGSGTGHVPGYQGERLVGFAPVPSTGWAIIAETSPATINSLINGLTARLVAIGLVVLIIALGTSILVGLLLQRLGREHEQSRAVLSSVGTGVATIDPAGRPLRVNPALEDLAGRPAGDLEGHDWSDAFPLFDQQGEPVAWEGSAAAQAIRGENRVVSSSGYELHLARSDGRRVPVALTATPFVVVEKLSGAVVILRDVSQEREVDQLKSSLVSTVSHELRTPLTMIQGFSELLLSREDLGAVRSRDALQQIHASSQRLGRLIDDLLSVSRIESGKLTVDLGPVDLSGVIADVVGTFGGRTGHRFVTDLEAQLAPVLADQDKVVQVVTNLISNAVKYSLDHTAIEIVARTVGDHAELSVTDHGIGMTDDERSHLFEKFTRADRPEVRKAGGTGLGLYITKSLVELQRGQLWVRSSLGDGSTFSVSLPLANAPGSSATGRDQRGSLEEALDR